MADLAYLDELAELEEKAMGLFSSPISPISLPKFDADDPDGLSDEDQEISDRWQEYVPAGDFQTILEAKDKDIALASGIAAGILLAAWLYDRRKGVYLKPRTRRPLPPESLDALIEAAIATSKNRLINIHEQGLNDNQWMSENWDEISWLHTASFALGRGGLSAMTGKDRIKLKEILDFQREKLQGFNNDRQGMSESMQLSRILKYAQSAYGSFKAGEHQAAIARGMKEAKRILDPQSESCPGCVELAGMGWVGIDKIQLPGQSEPIFCSCLGNCRCRLVFR